MNSVYTELGFLCAFNKLTNGLTANPISSDEVYKIAGINAFSGREMEATDNLVQVGLLNEYIKLGIKREIMLPPRDSDGVKKIAIR
jgi:hypothetical protein